jgi:hypothetical protein
MSRASTTLCVLFAALALFVCSTGARGQTSEEYRARIDRLSQMLDEIEEEEREAERVRIEELMSNLDTLEVGRLVLITTTDHAASIVQAVERQWEKVEFALGPDGEAAERFVFYTGLPSAPQPGMSELQDSVPVAIGRLLAVRLDPDGSFIGELPFEPLAAGWRGAVYAALATADSRAARSCFLGDLESCRGVLGLIETEDPLSLWYTPEERRRLATRVNIGGQKKTRCIEGESDDACLELLRSVGEGSLAPLPPDGRRMLLDVALELGGEGTYGRIDTSGGSSIEERLASWRRGAHGGV